MTDQDLGRVILDAVPPLTPPPDRIQAIGRRVRRERRRIVFVSAAASATLVIVSAGAFGMVTAEGPTNPLPPLSIPSLSPSPSSESSAPSMIGGMPTEEPKLAKARLKAAAEDALHRAAPAVTVTGRFPVQHMNVGSGFGYNIGQLITANGRRGAVVITIELPQRSEPITCATQVAPNRLAQCHDLTGPHGEHIVSLPSTGDGSTNGKRNRTHVVRVVRIDGSIVTVECGNATKMNVPLGTPRDEVTDFGITTTSYTGKQPPLTIQQVTALALDPALTLYP